MHVFIRCSTDQIADILWGWRWPSGYEHWLPFQRTTVCSPAPTDLDLFQQIWCPISASMDSRYAHGAQTYVQTKHWYVEHFKTLPQLSHTVLSLLQKQKKKKQNKDVVSLTRKALLVTNSYYSSGHPSRVSPSLYPLTKLCLSPRPAM